MKPLEKNKSHVLVVVGVPGAGKTFFAKQFGDTFGAPHVDYEHFHELTGNVELGDKVATELLGQLFRTKQTIVMEGRGDTRRDRALLAKLVKAKGYELLYVWVQTEPHTAKQRALKLGYSERDLADRTEAFEPLSQNDPFVVISGKYTFPAQVKMVLKRIIVPRASAAQSRSPQQSPPQPIIQKRSGRIIIR